jgi:hypothetical protein
MQSKLEILLELKQRVEDAIISEREEEQIRLLRDAINAS